MGAFSTKKASGTEFTAFWATFIRFSKRCDLPNAIAFFAHGTSICVVSGASTLSVKDVDSSNEGDVDVEDSEHESSESNNEKAGSFQTLTWRQQAFENENENEVK